MKISDGWKRYDAPSEDVKQNTIVLASDNDTAGTVEEIRWHPLTGNVYRRRYWYAGRGGGAGEVWFDRQFEREAER